MFDARSGGECVQVFGVRVPVKAKPPERIRFQAPSGRRRGHFKPRDGKPYCGNPKDREYVGGGFRKPLIWNYVEYPSWAAACRATGLTKAVMRWRLLHK